VKVPGQPGTRPFSLLREEIMPPKKTLSQREKELQSLLATEAGRNELRALEIRYAARSGKERGPRMSVITWILVHERERGLISA
jgi:hypothetical protein